MKKRVYKIKDKILVQGNENELTEDEVLVKEENGEVFNIVVKGSSEPKYVNIGSKEMTSMDYVAAGFTMYLTQSEIDLIINNDNFTIDSKFNDVDTTLFFSKLSEIHFEGGIARFYQSYIAMGDNRLPFAATVLEIPNGEAEYKGMIQITTLNVF